MIAEPVLYLRHDSERGDQIDYLINGHWVVAFVAYTDGTWLERPATAVPVTT